MDFTFIPSLTIMGTFAIAAVILAITPGPDMALILARTIGQGRVHGLASVAGAYTGTIVHTVLAALGISVLLAASPPAFLALKICGALYLLWLAVDTLRNGAGLDLDASQKYNEGSLFQSYSKGVLINLLNPKIVLFFITFLPQFVDRSDAHATGKLLFLGAEFVVLTIPIMVAMVFGAHVFAHTLGRSKRLQKWLSWSFSGVFASFALTVLLVEAKQ